MMSLEKAIDRSLSKEMDEFGDGAFDVLPDGKIKHLISQLESRERRSAINSFKKFEGWLKEPRLARVEWLLDVYKKNGWIDDDEVIKLREQSVDEAYKDLRRVCLENLELRKGINVKKINIDSDSDYSDLKIGDLLGENGVEGTNLKVRRLDQSSRLDLVMASGTDRDANSTFHNSGSDGEELAMIRVGIPPMQSTYVYNLRPDELVSIKEGQMLLVYSGDALTYIGPNSFPLSNGFSAFHFYEDFIISRSLLAVIQIEKK